MDSRSTHCAHNLLNLQQYSLWTMKLTHPLFRFYCGADGTRRVRAWATAALVASMSACVPMVASDVVQPAQDVVDRALADAADANADATGDAPSQDNDGGSQYQTLRIPEVLTGTEFALTLAASTMAYREGAPTTTYGYNGAAFWGPTLIMNRGDMVQMHVNNRLAQSTTTHWHGFHIPAAMDGGPHQPIPAGTTWSPRFEIKNNAGTYWYHPHLHHTTQAQLTYGAGGLIIVRDAQEAALALPRTYGVDDIPLVLMS